MSLKRMICEYCFAEIGKFDTGIIKLPLTPVMFTSPDEKHEIPAPFPPGQKTWMDFRCPICLLRPLVAENLIACYDSKGFNDVFEVKEPKDDFKCENCGKTYQHQSSLHRHRREAHA